MPLFGAARISQAMAPRNGGVTNEAITKTRTSRRPARSVRATSQASGVAMTHDRRPTLSAMAKAVRYGRRSVGSETSAAKLASVSSPFVPRTL